jgi:hypothetical protein
MEWISQKKEHGQTSKYLDKVMPMVGLEEIKAHFLAVKASIDAAKQKCHDYYTAQENPKDSDKYRNSRNLNPNMIMVVNIGTGPPTTFEFFPPCFSLM